MSEDDAEGAALALSYKCYFCGDMIVVEVTNPRESVDLELSYKPIGWSAALFHRNGRSTPIWICPKRTHENRRVS
jgi:hypothetical protein